MYYRENGEEEEDQEEESSKVRKKREDGGRGSVILGIGYLAGLGRGKKAGSEGRSFEMAVLEPSSKVLEVLVVLVSAWQQGAALKR